MRCIDLHSDSDLSLLISLTYVDDINIFVLNSLEKNKNDPKLVLKLNFETKVAIRLFFSK